VRRRAVRYVVLVLIYESNSEIYNYKLFIWTYSDTIDTNSLKEGYIMDNVELIDGMTGNAKTALAEFAKYDQEQVDACIKAMLLAFKSNAAELSGEVIEETGLGDYESKLEENTGSPDSIWYALKGKKSVGIIGEDREKRLKFVAFPQGDPLFRGAHN
jgi:succinate-semialdehyde dehydrogenase